MENIITLESHKQLLSSGLSLSFKGVVDVEMVDHVLAAIHSRLETIEENSGVRKKVYLVLVECLQNLCKQIDSLHTITECNTEYQTNVASFNVEGNESAYEIATANFIANDKIEKLRAWLDEINGYDKVELKQVYNKILTNHTFTEYGGAGLGFVDIAMKTGNKLNFKFDKIDENFSFFIISVTVNKNIN